MAKKEKKKPSGKPKTKAAAKAKKVSAKTKKAKAPAKKVAATKKKVKKAAATKRKAKAPVKKAAAPKKKATPKAVKTTESYSVTEFADMTYLTENGVMEWLQRGLLIGRQDAKGNWQVEAANLEDPNVKRFVR